VDFTQLVSQTSDENTIVFALALLLTPTLLITGCDKAPTESANVRQKLPPPTAESNQRRLTTPQEGITLHMVAAQSNFTRSVLSGAPADVAGRIPIRPRVAPELIPENRGSQSMRASWRNTIGRALSLCQRPRHSPRLYLQGGGPIHRGPSAAEWIGPYLDPSQ